MVASRNADLRSQVRQRLEDGRLSGTTPEETQAGIGSRRPCAVCSEIISSENLEYEIESATYGVQHFHFACYVAWFIERRGS